MNMYEYMCVYVCILLLIKLRNDFLGKLTYDLVEIVFNMCIKLKSGEHALSLYSC